MTRHIVLGNGSLLVNIDRWFQMRDIYFPHVGQENHLLGHAHRIGVFTDRISWVNDDDWKRTLSYKRNTLVSDCTAENQNLGISLEVNDCVECEKNIFLKRVKVKNAGNRRTVAVFFQHDFHLYSNGIGDTAGFDPIRNALFHYKRNRYFLISASIGGKGSDIFEYSVGTADEHTTSDAEDGRLDKHSIAQGSVDSICSIKLDLPANGEKTFYYWICCGQDFKEVHALNDFVFKMSPKKLFRETELCWQGFVNQSQPDFKDLDENITEHYKRSILVMRTQIDNNGAIVAANDSDNMQFNHDTYSYVWPRDAALVAISLQKAGYSELVKPFYNFCKDVIDEGGFFLHKYTPDKTLGSSWHPWVKNGKPNLPIQEDGTALVLKAIWHYYETTKDKKLIKELYKPVIKKAADFLVAHRRDGLPKESYDLWEERQGILTYTTSTVRCALSAAAKLARVMNDSTASEYEKAAKEIHAALGRLYDPKKKRFIRMISEGKRDDTVESTLYSIFAFGGFDPEDERVINTMKQIEEKLSNTGIGGIARYEGDYYHKAVDDAPGNPWFICTMWLGSWYLAIAKEKNDLAKVKDILSWCVKYSLETGLMPEQVHPHTGKPLSVTPLTWSHAEFVWLVQDYIKKYDEIHNRGTNGES